MWDSPINSNSPICLSVAGSDPSGGAGIQLDARIFSSLGCYPCTIPAVLTVQNTTGVSTSFPVETNVLKQQLEFLLSDIVPAAAKIGAIGSLENLDFTLQILQEYKIPVIVDPVILSSNSNTLLETSAPLLLDTLSSRTNLCTPNVPEAEFLLGRPISSLEEMKSAVEELASKLKGDVLLKGGHLESALVTDLLIVNDSFRTFESNRISGVENIHGTGCALSSAITAFLAKGIELSVAVEQAKEWFATAITKTFTPGHGFRIFC